MDIFQEALTKAKEEGKIDPRLLPWDKPKSDSGKTKITITKNVQMPPQLMMLTDDVIDDFLKTIENIRIEAETKSLHIIGITSAVQGHGTSTFTAILALIMAVIERANFNQIDLDDFRTKKAGDTPKPGVLLIDAQLRNPSLHNKLEVIKRGGLVEILENEIPFKKSIKRINDTDLKFISIGENNNFHLTPRHMEKLKSYLEILKTKIEFILLDIPPILQYSEGIALSKLCDGIILVIQAGETRWEVVQQAKRLLDKAHVNLIGGVLNRRKFYISNWAYKNL